MPGAASEWRFRPARASDEPALLELFAAVFGRPVSASHWRWKLGGPAGSEVATSWVGVGADDRPVFHYGGLPRRLLDEGRARDVMVAVDAMTAPAARRRGLLTAGARHVHEAWRRAGFDAVLGLPNEQYGSRTEAIGWQPLFELRWHARLLRPAAVLARRLRLPRALRRLAAPVDGLLLASRRRGGTGADPGAEAETLDGGLRLDRGAAWWRWRFEDSPDWRYEVTAGADARCATRRVGGGRTAVVAAAEAPDPAALVRLLRARGDALAKQGSELMTALAPAGSRLEGLLRAAGLRHPRASFGLHVVPLSPSLDLARWRDASAWWLEAGDFDVG